MPVSRLRLRLSGGFAIAFSIGLAILAAGTLGYLWHESNRRFDARLQNIISGVATGLERELTETPDSSLAYVGEEVVAEWPPNGDGFLITDASGRLIATLDHENISSQILAASAANSHPRLYDIDEQPPIRALAVDTTLSILLRPTRVRIVAFASSQGIEDDTEMLAALLLVSIPLIALISLVAGYLLSGRALLPVRALAANVAAIVPSDLSYRLTINGSKDELGTLATEFNALLDRLEVAQKKNRRFVRETAHQIRTPLTLVLGESEHALSNSDESYRRLCDAIVRIRLAAEQMRRRVDDLFLLAEAEAGEPLRLEEQVEMDGMLLECMDLMRARAASTGHGLEIGAADAAVVEGNSALLREAMLELIENACRHGTAGTRITASVVAENGTALLRVRSVGDEFALNTRDRKERDGMGISIVQWVVQSHNGSMSLVHDGEYNHVLIRVPLLVRQNA